MSTATVKELITVRRVQLPAFEVKLEPKATAKSKTATPAEGSTVT